MSTGFHPHTHLLALASEVTIKLFRSLTVFQSLLSTISRFSIHKRNFLEARVVIASYNDHCPALSFLPEPFWLVSTTKAYSGIGAGVVMESISLFYHQVKYLPLGRRVKSLVSTIGL